MNFSRNDYRDRLRYELSHLREQASAVIKHDHKSPYSTPCGGCMHMGQLRAQINELEEILYDPRQACFDGVVRTNSKVTLQRQGQTATETLVLDSNRANTALGTAILGRREGDTVGFLDQDEVVLVDILEVVSAPVLRWVGPY